MKTITRIVFVTLSLLLIFSAHRVMAQTEKSREPNPTPTPVSLSEELAYPLPYPGILPDHPLYIFKQIRDNIMQLFISDPVKRIEFSLLQSDKYLSMANAFADQKKWDWAGKSVLSSQKEMEQAIAEVKTARTRGVTVPGHDIVSLERSTVKHKERIDAMKTQSQEQPNGIFAKASDAFAQLAAQASALREE